MKDPEDRRNVLTHHWDKQDLSLGQAEILPGTNWPFSVQMYSRFDILSGLSLGWVGFVPGTIVLRGGFQKVFGVYWFFSSLFTNLPTTSLHVAPLAMNTVPRRQRKAEGDKKKDEQTDRWMDRPTNGQTARRRNEGEKGR